MASIGSVELIAKIDTSQYKKGAADIEKANKDIENSTEDVDKKGTNSFASFGKGAAKGIGIATVALTAFAAVAATAFLKSAVESASQLQSIRASFESLTGSAETARNIIGDLNRFSLETAFSNDTINSASRTLLGFGVSADNLLTVMRQLGDIAGATGGDLSSLALVTGQVFAQGKLQAQDYYQIINSGAGTLAAELRKVVKEKTGLDDIKEAFQDGLVTAEMYAEALRRSNAEGGFAFEGAIKQSKTFEGRVSNLQEGITNIGLAIIGVDRTTGDVQVGGLFDNLSVAVSALTVFIDENKDEIISFINSGIKPLGEAFMIAVQAIQALILWMKPLIDYVAQNQQVMEVLKITLIALGAILLGTILLAIGAVIVVMVALTATINLLITVFTFLGEVAVGTVNLIGSELAQLAAFASKAFHSFQYEAGKSFYEIKDIAIRTVDDIIKYFYSIPGKLRNTFNGLGSSLAQAVKDALNSLLNLPLKVPSVTVAGQTFGGQTLIPKLAEGGIVSRPTLAMIGEGGESEAVIPLSKLDNMLNGTTNNNSDITVNITLSGVMTSSKADERAVANRIGKLINETLTAKGAKVIEGL